MDEAMEIGKIRKDQLGRIFDFLKETYRTIGPRAEEKAIVLAEIGPGDIPAGFRASQGPGRYTKEAAKKTEVFSFPAALHSFKTFLHPPVQEVFSFEKTKRGITVQKPSADEKPCAFIGVRACDLAALRLLDKVFLGSPVVEPHYDGRRRHIFVIAVNCAYPGENCFCDSMGTGPQVTSGFDVAITELEDHFLLEAGSPQGMKLLEALPLTENTDRDLEEKNAQLKSCRSLIHKSMMTGDLPGIIYRNMEHPRWQEIAGKDLECGNCTMVCPTCFCNSSYDLLPLSMLTGNPKEFRGKRMRTWDSCFSHNFARVHGGNFRPSRRARYRHWMTHKLAYWIDQFGAPGCVGCGRCITWCPVGIDITHELEELRGAR